MPTERGRGVSRGAVLAGAVVLLVGCSVVPDERPPRTITRMERQHLASQAYRPDSLRAGPDTSIVVRLPGEATDVRFVVWTDQPADVEIIVGMPTREPQTWPAVWSGSTERVGISNGATVITPPLDAATRGASAQVVIRGANRAISQVTWLRTATFF